MSLQHALLHGHPTRSARLNRLPLCGSRCAESSTTAATGQSTWPCCCGHCTDSPASPRGATCCRSPALSLALLRSFYEHRRAALPAHRIAINDAGWG